MVEPLTLDRFRALAEAYGGTLARWPEADRAAASAMAEDPVCRAILVHAAVLDRTLDLWASPTVSSDLSERVVRSAGVRRRRPRLSARLLWPTIGLAAALAGMAAGSLAMAGLTSPDVPGDMVTVFGDVAGSGS